MNDDDVCQSSAYTIVQNSTLLQTLVVCCLLTAHSSARRNSVNRFVLAPTRAEGDEEKATDAALHISIFK